MALTSTDQAYGEQLQIKDKTNEGLIQQNNLLKNIAQSLMISGAGGSPGQPYTPPKEDPKNPYVPAPKQKLARANNIRGFQDKGWQLNIPLHDWKQIPPGIKNDPDFIRLHLRRMQALGINPNMLAGGPQLPNFKPMGPVRTGVRKGVLTPEENKIKRPLQIRGA